MCTIWFFSVTDNGLSAETYLTLKKKIVELPYRVPLSHLSLKPRSNSLIPPDS